jgi:hypothetical protein
VAVAIVRADQASVVVGGFAYRAFYRGFLFGSFKTRLPGVGGHNKSFKLTALRAAA